MPAQFDQAILLAREQHCSLREAEIQIFHTGHGRVGAYLIGLWGLPGPVVEAIGFHHCLDGYPADSFSPALAVHVANALYYSHVAQGTEEETEKKIIGAPTGLDDNYLKKIGMSDKVEGWREMCAEMLRQ
jgi:HD-like signal output (HDOD) protein